MINSRFWNKRSGYNLRRNSLINYLQALSPGIFLILPLLFFAACGNKGPLSLKAYEKPQAPSGLSALHMEDRIILSWAYPEDMRTAIKGFQILRSSGGDFERIAFIANDKTFFEDDGFKLNSRYKYNIIAKSLKDVYSSDSNIITIMPRPLPLPPAQAKLSIKPDSIELSWDSSGESACYNVYRTAEKGKYSTPLNAEPLCAATFRDNIIFTDRNIYYTVRALLKGDMADVGYASAELEVKISLMVPSAPSDVRVVKGSERTYLIWKENPEVWVKGYSVYRKISGETEFIKSGEVKMPAFTDSEKINKMAWYMIRARGPLSEGPAVIVEVPAPSEGPGKGK